MGRENESGEAYQAKVGALGRAYADALLAADEAAAEIAIREAMEAGLDTAQIDDEIITPALWHVGDLWERGEISVADEHIATEISIRVLALQREAQRVARTRGDYRIVLAAPPGEQRVGVGAAERADLRLIRLARIVLSAHGLSDSDHSPRRRPPASRGQERSSCCSPWAVWARAVIIASASGCRPPAGNRA